MRKLILLLLLLSVSVSARPTGHVKESVFNHPRFVAFAPPSVGLRLVARSFTLGATNTPVNLNTAMLALSPPPGFPLTFSELIIVNDSSDSGNLGLSDNSAVSAESQTLLLTSGSSIRLQMTTPNDPISPGDIWLISATLNKKVQVIARSAR